MTDPLSADDDTLPEERKALRDLDKFTVSASKDVDSDPAKAAASMSVLIDNAVKKHYRSSSVPSILTNMTSVLINAGMALNDQEALAQAEHVLIGLISNAHDEAQWRCRAQYNLANATDHAADFRARSSLKDLADDDKQAAFYRARSIECVAFRTARFNFALAAKDDSADQQTRALTNLANTLSTSGRWLEAYERYVQAVQADPTNGNAAGNAALCLVRAIRSNLGPRGHLAAVYEKYRQIAQRNRERTIQLAGQEAADRWDRLAPIDTPGHLSHSASGDPYVQWVARERLALTPVMDGLGSDSEKFDTVRIATFIDSTMGPDVPTIFAAGNVMKADYLAARSTAYRGLTMISDADDGWALHSSDTGTYANTLDYAVYGEPVSLVSLGARAALDVLDKIAVTLNEYLSVGDDAGSVNFRTFWRGKKVKQNPNQEIRTVLWRDGVDGSRVLALAELADDMDTQGLYAQTQAIRNRSTHRLVRAKLFGAEGVTNTALSTLDLEDLRAGCLESLRVARIALLYFHAFVAATEQQKSDTQGGVAVRRPITDVR
jgi:tetratricopeptide (TPR) repeat protein